VNDLPRMMRLGLFAPVAFISLAGVVVAVVITYRSWRFDQAEKDAQKQAIESHLLIESARMAEEVYLNLDNWQAREKQIATYFQGNGASTKLQFQPTKDRDYQSADTRIIMQWKKVESGFGDERLEMPLYFSDLFVGAVLLDVAWGKGLSPEGIIDLSVMVLGPILVIILLWLVTVFVLKRKVVTPLLEQMMRAHRLEAISETTQMIAHDMRKPFHVLRLSLQTLKKFAVDSTDPRVLRLTNRLTPTIDKVSAEVDDMLRDLVSLERPNSRNQVETSLGEVILNTVDEYKSLKGESDATINMDFGHKHKALIDRFKIQRVLSNLLQNALNAVESGGRVWISTIEQIETKQKRKIVVCVGNSGSLIAKDDIKKVFDRFFSKGKQNGTGLGLAIAKKFVEANGGNIWCESNATTGTRFYFSVAATNIMDSSRHNPLGLDPL
jgi:signal transduction histidine kinase